MIPPVQGPALRWQRAGRRHRWAVDASNATPLRFSAAHGLLMKSSVQITVQQEIPEPTVVLLRLIGGFLALRELQAEADGGAAVAGIVGTGAASRARRRQGCRRGRRSRKQ